MISLFSIVFAVTQNAISQEPIAQSPSLNNTLLENAKKKKDTNFQL